MQPDGGLHNEEGSTPGDGDTGQAEAHTGEGEGDGEGEVVQLPRRLRTPLPGKRVTNRDRYGMVVGKMPEGLRGLERDLRHFRNSLEAAVQAKYGELSFWATALINEATMHEGMRAVAWRHVKLTPGMMPPLDVLAAVARFTSFRNRALERLHLDALVAGDIEAAPLDWDRPASEEAIERAIRGGRPKDEEPGPEEEGDGDAD